MSAEPGEGARETFGGGRAGGIECVGDVFDGTVLIEADKDGITIGGGELGNGDIQDIGECGDFGGIGGLLDV